ncbi:hypothetical protein C8K63_107297 [Pseudomonas sp. GV085]|nr:hypothetical protein C8K63_107297 [Pseudomonas sp. GV085]
MVVNDNVYLLAKRGVLESIASRLAPTGSGVIHYCWFCPFTASDTSARRIQLSECGPL